jgi:hemerythrin superfamily protein
MATATDPDVVDLLLEQHEHIRELFDRVRNTGNLSRQERFDELRRFLAVHETAEEMVVHPRLRAQDDRSKHVVEQRLEEEHSAKESLANLDDLDVDAPDFMEQFEALEREVLAHAANEEREEFPLLRSKLDSDELVKMAAGVKATEAIAPTRPHPGVESATANLMAGPLASVIDRTRDAITGAMR